MNASHSVTDIEVVEDFSATARCDEGFLRVRRLRCRNLRADGSRSAVYRVDVVDRPRLDAVAVLVYRRGPDGPEALTRQNLRPAAYFRKDKEPAVPDARSHLLTEEIVAGLLEPEDHGLEGVRARAAAEVREEAGIEVDPGEVQLLGAPFFVAPGILSEKIFLAAVDATGKPQASPAGDGSPLEEGGEVRWRPMKELLEACRSGEVADAKTELAITRYLANLPDRTVATS
ncbi:MAG: NUDIX hydrolase [Myxococcaceae bacterium]